MQVNLYKISQDSNRDYDTFDSAIVAAYDENGARNISPDSFHRWGAYFSSWCKTPEEVTVEFIGVAKEGTPIGVVLASFNAG